MFLPHPRNLAEVLRAALGRLFAADFTRIGGNLRIFNGAVAMGTSKHISRLEQALLINKEKDGELNI